MVLVTGGGKGLGRMISEGFVTNGAKVYVSSRDAKACEKAAAELTALGMLHRPGREPAAPGIIRCLREPCALRVVRGTYHA